MWPFTNKQQDDSNVIIIDKGIIRDHIEEIVDDSSKVEEIVDKISTEIKDYIESKEKTTIDFQEIPYVIEKHIKNFIFKRNNDRLKICREVDILLDNYPEAKQSVRIYASTIAYGSPEFKLDEFKFIITKKDDTISDDIVSGAKKFLREFEKKSKIKRYIYLLASDLVKYEDAFLEKIFDNNGNIVSFAYIPSNSVYFTTDNFGNILNLYQVLTQSIDYHDILSNKYDKTKVIKFEPNEFVHINDGSLVGIGESPLTTLIPIWRSYRLLQESLIIHRLTRAKRYTVFFVDVTDKERSEIRKSIMAFVQKLRNFFSENINTGDVYSYKSSIRTGEDLVIPITKNSATKMQIIPADTGAHKIDDLEFFHDRLLNILFTEHLFGRNKKGKSPDVEKAFNRLIRVYQRQLAWSLEEIYSDVLRQNGFDGLDVSILFPSPDSEEEIKLVDTLVRRLLLINQLTTVLGRTLPFEWVLEYVFKDLTMEQIEQLKEMLLKEQEEPSGEKELVEQLIDTSKSKPQETLIPEEGGIPEEQFNDLNGFKEIFEKSKEIIDFSLRYLEMKK